MLRIQGENASEIEMTITPMEMGTIFLVSQSKGGQMEIERLTYELKLVLQRHAVASTRTVKLLGVHAKDGSHE